jgi:hypothetical protein
MVASACSAGTTAVYPVAVAVIGPVAVPLPLSVHAPVWDVSVTRAEAGRAYLSSA